MKSYQTRIILGLAVGLLGCPVLVAQQSTGTLKGRVTEKGSGTPKAGIIVTAENLATGFVRTQTTSADGQFKISILPVGTYKLTYKGPDFTATLNRTSALGQETDASISVAAGKQASATVEVIGQSDSLGRVNTTSAEVGINITSENLSSLPIVSRDVVAATVLAPGIQVIPGSQVSLSKKGTSYMSQGNGTGRGTNFNIDGGDNNSSDVGGQAGGIPLDAVGEFQVPTNQYKAEFGRSTSGFLNMVSKAGSNQFAGLVTAQFTNQALRSRTADENPKLDTKDQSYGATVLGPILKDKLFYMFSVEKRKQEAPSATFSAASQALWPDAVNPKATVEHTSAYARLDWVATQSLSVVGTFGYDKVETPNQAQTALISFYNGNSNPANLFSGENLTKRAGLKFTTLLSNNIVWESNFVYFDYKNTLAPMPDPDGNDSYFSVRTRSSGLLPLPPNQQAYLGYAGQNGATGIKRFQWRNDVTATYGDHSLKAGLDYQSSKFADTIQGQPTTGVYQFALFGFGLADLRNAYAPIADPDVNVNRAWIVQNGRTPGNEVKQYGLYLQDDFRVSSVWSVYGGLRVDKDNSLDFMQSSAIQDIYRQIYTTSPGFIRGASAPKDKTYVSPRLQLVYRPKGDESQVYTLGFGRFIANTIDQITGYARQLNAHTNGLNSDLWVDNLGNPYSFQSSPYTAPSFRQGAVWNAYPINGHVITLPADLTPYNYAHNVNGLKDYFANTVNSWLTTASFATNAKNLLASDFEYPTTDTLSLSGAWKLNDRNALEANLLWSRSKNITASMNADGVDQVVSYSAEGVPIFQAAPTHSIGPDGAEMYDNIIYSNQKAETFQVSLKHVYNSPRFSSQFNITYRDVRSSSGGANGAFDNSGWSDVNGTGTVRPYETGSLRPARGTEKLLGSFFVNYKASWGTNFGLLGTWHGPKQYDQYLGYNEVAYNLFYNQATSANRPTIIGTATGAWNADLGLRIAHAFKIGQAFAVEPFLSIQNLLNNYDYGSSYYNTKYDVIRTGPTTYVKTENPNFGQRQPNFAINAPRTLFIGVRATF